MKRKIIALLHAEFEQPGYITTWAQNNHFEIEEIHCWRNPVYPDPSTVERLLIMGGPMGVYEVEENPWLKKELAFIRAVIDAGQRVLGVCLGSQLIAAAMGANVYPHEHREIGWFGVKWNQNAFAHPLTYGVSSQSKVFHYHGDTFDLPDNAQLLASSRGCQNQAFALGENVLALQFHLEVTHDLLEEMLYHEGELTPAQFVQTKDQIWEGLYDVMQNHTDLSTLLENMWGK